MKFFSFTAIAAAALISFASCNKQTDTTVADSNDTGNGSVKGGGAGFSWSGQEPMSAIIDGDTFLATNMQVLSHSGFLTVIGDNGLGTQIAVNIPESTLPGQVYAMPSVGQIAAVFPNASTAPSNGKLKVTKNSAATFEAYFWSDMVDGTHTKDTLVHIREGYVKVNR